jgi:hypothetical protein
MSELSEILSQKLLIGRAFIRALRLLAADDAKKIRDGFPLRPDKDAVERLYRDSVRESLSGSDLRIRARRGSARCSEMVPLAITPL